MKKLSKKIKFLDQEHFFNLYDQFINHSYNGLRVKNNGQRIRSNSVTNQLYTKKLLREFADLNKIEFKLFIVNNLSENDVNSARIHWRKFYIKFTDFLYKEKKYFDNYVGTVIKNIRCFLNYLINHYHLQIGNFHRQFYVPKEEIPIIVVSPTKLKYLIADESLNQQLSRELAIIKDVFVFGCSVALRVSDLLNLQKHQILEQDGKYYLRVRSIKTSTESMVKLAPYAIDILKKYKNKTPYIFPRFTMAHFNRKLKLLAQHISTEEPLIKIRYRRGKAITIYKNKETKTHYTLADHITTHTMRRTAITTMLRFGMPEQVVRKISGHAANSKEFFRYVAFSQVLIDTEIDKVFDKLANYN